MEENPLPAAQCSFISIGRDFWMESKQAATQDKSPDLGDTGLVSRAVQSEGVQPSVPHAKGKPVALTGEGQTQQSTWANTAVSVCQELPPGLQSTYTWEEEETGKGLELSTDQHGQDAAIPVIFTCPTSLF